VPQAVAVLDAAEVSSGLEIEFVDIPVGAAAYKVTDHTLPPRTLG
jgi:isocitrate/isopropylmalate dehydrogenase